MSRNYPHNIESKIGFDTIRTILKEKCESALGVTEVENIEFSTDYRHVMTLLSETLEMRNILSGHAEFPQLSFNDVNKWLLSLGVEGSYASPEEVNQLRKTLKSFEEAVKFFCAREGSDDDSGILYPALNELVKEISSFPELLREINRIIDDTAYVKDSASPELAEVRQEIARMAGSISRTIQRVYARAVKEGIADPEAGPTIRDGKAVIPVSAANKRRISGIVLDESATGKTAFIEPLETVEINNRLRELHNEEQRIIVKILIEFTDKLRLHIPEILEGNRILGKIDFIMAKARFAIETGAEMPTINKHPEIDWYGAKHPVLQATLRQQKKEVVPLDIRITSKRRFLIISGPNAGGKSVVLKTVGVNQYMMQCGILPLMYSNSHMGIFGDIFVSIGDEQSIENDLSTYSSHLRNMRHFVLRANKNSLLLIDEIGSGTEPTIGASLSRAILLELAASHSYTIVTTHYHNLKQLADETEGFINGAMLYDRQKLEPTFQLSIGNAGSSFALEIATKIGLPKKIIDAAKEYVGEDYVESDKFMMEIARDKKYWQAKRLSIKEQETRLKTLESKYNALIEDLRKRKSEILKDAKAEAQELLQGANRKIENTISQIRKADAEKERTKELRRQLEDFKSKVEDTDTEKINLPKTPSLPLPGASKKNRKKREKNPVKPVTSVPPVNDKKEFEVGDYVRMEGSSTTGKILSVEGKEAEVAFGALRTKVKLTKLSHASAPSGTTATSSFRVINETSGEASRQRQLSFRDELDIRGFRADEALDALIHYIDDAIQFRSGKVRILHGTGNGILRQLVRQQLSATPGVAKFEDEDVRLGGSGVTVVMFK